MSEKAPATIVTKGTNKMFGTDIPEHTYQASGFTLSGHDGVPHFKPVDGGAEVATRQEDGTDKVEFVPSGTTLNFENDQFKHTVVIK